MATLTGAVVKALGYELSGLMTQDEPLRWLRRVAMSAGGRCRWRLKKRRPSAIADLCNTPTNNAAISASAAWLLHHFCPPTIPWAHLDISGTALWRERQARGIGKTDSLMVCPVAALTGPTGPGGAAATRHN
jgi:leucyl aminopeptidase